MMKSIIIAAPHSGSGKTTITLGIMECLRRKGLTVAPFKVGPDFIDPGYHLLVTGRPSVNLDGWMCGPDFVQETYARHAMGADFTVIEGVMGLFDGFGGTEEDGSTAQVARLTGAPIILVVDARSMARSAAAVVKGFAEFDPQVRLAAVIFNNVASDNHARILRQAMATSLPKVAVLGCLRRDEKLHIPSRHLGLLTAEENPLPSIFLDHLVETLRAQIDFALLWQVATPHGAPEIPLPEKQKAGRKQPVRIGVARDAAFCFMYHDNLRLLQQAGAHLVEFSPLKDDHLPAQIQGMYLPGGYPEVFAESLAANVSMKTAMRQAIEAGMPVYAECGGLIYLTQGVLAAHQDAQVIHEFVGIFPLTTRMLTRRKSLGYREIRTVKPFILGKAGMVARGHEFHYSEIVTLPASVERLYQVRKGDDTLGMEGFSYKNCLASYIHLHFGSCPHIAINFVSRCRKFAP